MKSHYAMVFSILAGACGSEAGLDASDLVVASCETTFFPPDAQELLKDAGARTYSATVKDGTVAINTEDAGTALLKQRMNILSSRLELENATLELAVSLNQTWRTSDPPVLSLFGLSPTPPVKYFAVDYVLFALEDALFMAQFMSGTEELKFILQKTEGFTSELYCDLRWEPVASPTACVREETETTYSVGECYFKDAGLCRCTASSEEGLLGGGTTNASWSCSAERLIGQTCRD